MLRFTIRDVLWLTVVVGLAVGWWLDRGELVYERAIDKGDARVWRRRTELLKAYLDDQFGIKTRWEEGDTNISFDRKVDHSATKP
jgi:hypothetical protein